MFSHICFGSRCCTHKRFHNGRQSLLSAEKSVAVQLPEGSMCLSKKSTPSTLGFLGFRCFCIAAVVAALRGWLLRDTLQSPDLRGAGGLRNVWAAQRGRGLHRTIFESEKRGCLTRFQKVLVTLSSFWFIHFNIIYSFRSQELIYMALQLLLPPINHQLIVN